MVQPRSPGGTAPARAPQDLLVVARGDLAVPVDHQDRQRAVAAAGQARADQGDGVVVAAGLAERAQSRVGCGHGAPFGVGAQQGQVVAAQQQLGEHHHRGAPAAALAISSAAAAAALAAMSPGTGWVWAAATRSARGCGAGVAGMLLLPVRQTAQGHHRAAPLASMTAAAVTSQPGPSRRGVEAGRSSGHRRLAIVGAGRATPWRCLGVEALRSRARPSPPGVRCGRGRGARSVGPCCPELAVRPGELLAKLLVLLAQVADLGARGLKAASERGVRGTLSGRDRWCGRGARARGLSGSVRLHPTWRRAWRRAPSRGRGRGVAARRRSLPSARSAPCRAGYRPGRRSRTGPAPAA